jgi:hypothetical protein
MIEKSAPSRWAGFVSGLLDLNHTRIISFASVLQIAKFVPSPPHTETNFTIRTLGANDQAVEGRASLALREHGQRIDLDLADLAF